MDQYVKHNNAAILVWILKEAQEHYLLDVRYERVEQYQHTQYWEACQCVIKILSYN